MEQPGTEEICVFKLHSKMLLNPDQYFGIRSIICRTSLPGFIIAEAISTRPITVLCDSVLDVFSRDVMPFPEQQIWSYLWPFEGFAPQNKDWIRIRGGPYRGDIAYVSDMNDAGTIATVCIVPRINYSDTLAVQANKTGEQRQSGRPDRNLFNLALVREIYGGDSVQVRNRVVFVFQNNWYRHGLLEMHVKGPFRQAVPTTDDIHLFSQAMPLDEAGEFVKEQVRRLEVERFQIGDNVKVVKGELARAVGFVADLNESTVDLITFPDMLRISLPLTSIRKNFHVGDQVLVHTGPHKNLIGWVISKERDLLMVCNPHSNQEVCFYFLIF